MKITNYRKKQKISQAEFAITLNISRSSVVNIEAGRQHTPPHILWQISQVLKLPINDLFPSETELENFPSTLSILEALNPTSVSSKKQESISDFMKIL